MARKARRKNLPRRRLWRIGKTLIVKAEVEEHFGWINNRLMVRWMGRGRT